MGNKINPNKCPHCGNESAKKLVDYHTTMDVLWCAGCEGDYEVLYERNPIEVIVGEETE